MTTSSHLLRVQQKRLYRKFILGFSSIILGLIALIFVGLPLLAKIILLIAPGPKDVTTAGQSADGFLFPPVLDPLIEATNSAKISVSGIGEKNAKVKILVNDKVKLTLSTDQDGRFLTKNLLLEQGSNSILAVSVKDDKESSPSSPAAIQYSNEPPTLEITTPSDNEKFMSDHKDILIQGETDPDNKVIIDSRPAIVGVNGKFTFKITLSDGENIIKITAQDPAGNTKVVEKKVNYIP